MRPTNNGGFTVNKQNKQQRRGSNPRPSGRACKPFLADKMRNHNEKIYLLENNNIISDSVSVANIFNEYFINITRNLNILKVNANLLSTLTDPVDKAIHKYSQHTSILKIKAHYIGHEIFQFKPTKPEDIYKIIMSLDPTKMSSGPFNTKVLQTAAKTCSNHLSDCVNKSIDDCIFPDVLKQGDVSPIFKKDDSTIKSNYRPISILPTSSKVFEKVLFEQMSKFFEKIFSKLLCGFRKGHSTQHALLKLIQRWQKTVDNSNYVGTILMDLSKAFDCISHDLLIAKLSAYGFHKNSLKLIYSYLSNRKQRTRIDSLFSTWLEIVMGVPQGSILGPLLFNIFLNDLFLILESTENCNFADDNTLYSCNESLESVISDLETDTSNVLDWLKVNQLVANPSKFQLMFLGNIRNKLCLEINGEVVNATDTVKLLGVTIDNKLKFNKHVSSICKSANQKVNALHRFRKFTNTEQTRSLCYAFIFSKFNYCPLIWMFCGKIANSNIDRVQKRALRAVYNEPLLNLDELLKMDNSLKTHSRNLQTLLIEIYKSINRLNPEIMWDIFSQKTLPYNFRSTNLLKLPSTKTVNHGTNAFVFRGSLIWNYLPDSLKNAQNLSLFKSELCKLDNIGCTCKICS